MTASGRLPPCRESAKSGPWERSYRPEKFELFMLGGQAVAKCKSKKAPTPKRYPEGYLFFTTKLRLAAAGARQELRVQVRAVTRIATTPAEDCHSAHVGGGHRRQRATRVLQRDQRDHRAVDTGRASKALDRHRDLSIVVGTNELHVLRGSAGRGACDFATPVVDSRRAGGALEDLGNRGAARARSQDHFGYLRPVAVVLIRRQCYCGQNADDRNNDHQLDQGKALLNRSHGYSLLDTPIWRLGW